MRLENMLKHVQVHKSTTETQRVSTGGNFTLAFVSLAKLAMKNYSASTVALDLCPDKIEKVCNSTSRDDFAGYFWFRWTQ